MTFILAGTGSRSLQLASPEAKRRVLQDIHAAFDQYAPTHVMSGMAEGFDTALAVAAIEAGIPLIAAVPTRSYGNYYWGKKSLTGEDRSAHFYRFLEQAAHVIYVCDSLYVNGVHANFVRNQYMVDHAQAFLVYNPASKGTADCLRRIRSAQLPYTIIPAV